MNRHFSPGFNHHAEAGPAQFVQGPAALVHVQLVRVESLELLWGATYELADGDIFSLRSRVADNVLKAIPAALSSASTAPGRDWGNATRSWVTCPRTSCHNDYGDQSCFYSEMFSEESHAILS